MNEAKQTWQKLWYTVSTILIMMIGGFWLGAILALVFGQGHVRLYDALRVIAFTIGILLVASIRYHRILRKICLPFLFIG